MAGKKKERLVWELKLIAQPGAPFSTSEDEEPSTEVLEVLALDTAWPSLWMEIPDQPDFDGRSRDAHTWLDSNAPLTGHYRLARMVGERLASVQMIKTIRTTAVQTDITFGADVDDAKEQIAKASESIGKLADAAEATKAPEESPEDGNVVDLDARRTGNGRETDTASPGNDSDSKEVRKDLEMNSNGATAGQLDLGDDKPPADDGTLVATRSQWEAAPLRTCRSLQDCCLCDEPIGNGDQYYDRGYGKRCHKAHIDDMADF